MVALDLAWASFLQDGVTGGGRGSRGLRERGRRTGELRGPGALVRGVPTVTTAGLCQRMKVFELTAIEKKRKLFGFTRHLSAGCTRLWILALWTLFEPLP